MSAQTPSYTFDDPPYLAAAFACRRTIAMGRSM
jgi:hypothetical protein